MSLLVIGSSDAAIDHNSVDETLDHWPEQEQPTTQRMTCRQAIADADIVTSTSVVWLIDDQPQLSSDMFEMIGRLQDRHIPVLFSHNDSSRPIGTQYQSGVVSAPIDTSPPLLHAMLSTLYSQVDTLRALRAEAELLRLQHGGLCDEIGRIDEELRMAAQLQRDMLPLRLPAVDNLQFKVLYRPAAYVSGDIYDVVQLDDEHLGIFVADAVGHGVPAALMTVFIKRSLNAAENDPMRPANCIVKPDEALRWLNAEMIRQQSSKVRFATACYGVLNTRTYKLSIARAGHPYPLVIRRGGELEWLKPEGGLLGVFPDEKYEAETIQLEPGDRMLFYSDGFEVAFGEQNGCSKSTTHQYEQEFGQLANGTLDQAFARLTHRLDESAGSLHQLDDLTAIAMAIGEAA